MSALYGEIQQAARQHEQLLRGLEELGNVHERLRQQTDHVHDLEAQMKANAKLIERVKNRVWNRRDRYEKYQRFALDPIANRDKLTVKAIQEWREYQFVMRLESGTEDGMAHIKKRLDEAEERRNKIRVEAKRYESLQTELDALYSRIFDGPTPEFPEEDFIEQTRDGAYAPIPSLKQHLDHQVSVVSLLKQISTKLSAARFELDRAYDASRSDVYVGRSVTKMRKLDYLDLAGSMLRQMGQLEAQLKQTAPSLPELSQVYMPEMTFTSAELVDSLLADTRMHGEIKHSIAQVNCAQKQCDAILQQQRDLRDSIFREACEAYREYLNADSELQKERRYIFDSVLSELQTATTT